MMKIDNGADVPKYRTERNRPVLGEGVEYGYFVYIEPIIFHNNYD